jgi:hypothetical protein
MLWVNIRIVFVRLRVFYFAIFLWLHWILAVCLICLLSSWYLIFMFMWMTGVVRYYDICLNVLSVYCNVYDISHFH